MQNRPTKSAFASKTLALMTTITGHRIWYLQVGEAQQGVLLLNLIMQLN